MNERLQELVEQADSTIYDQLDSNALDPFVEKFAELIIKEVFAKIEDERFEVYAPVVESVKKYFGVKE